MSNPLSIFDGLTHIQIGDNGELMELVSVEGLPSLPDDEPGTHRYKMNLKREMPDGETVAYTVEAIGRFDPPEPVTGFVDLC